MVAAETRVSILIVVLPSDIRYFLFRARMSRSSVSASRWPPSLIVMFLSL